MFARADRRSDPQLRSWTPGSDYEGRASKLLRTNGLATLDAGRDGTIVFAPEFNTPLHRVSALGGESTPVTDLDSETGFDSHRQPWFL